jgi:AraC-like DNA-binding protein
MNEQTTRESPQRHHSVWIMKSASDDVPRDCSGGRVWLRGFVDCAQVLELEIDAGSPFDGLTRLRGALNAMPISMGSETNWNVVTSIAAIFGAISARLGVRQHALVRDLMSASSVLDFFTAFDRCIDRLITEGERRGSVLPIPKGPPVKRALACIYRHCQDRNLRIEGVAREVGISRSSLSHLIKAETGSSFMEHLWRTRASNAVYLLQCSHFSIKEISNAVGFSGTTQMDRHCLSIFGRSPRTFRVDRK